MRPARHPPVLLLILTSRDRTFEEEMSPHCHLESILPSTGVGSHGQTKSGRSTVDLNYFETAGVAIDSGRKFTNVDQETTVSSSGYE
jgi:hypothetical protein